jgi:outer membrane protein with beta-barrel domain
MSTRSRGPAALLAAALLLAPVAAQAQGSGDGFLFQKPLGGFVLRGGLASTTASGDLYAFLADQFTLDKGDFRAPQIAADLLIRIAPRADLDFGIGFSRSNKGSHFRDWVDLDNNEIEQATSLSRVPATVGARIYLAPPGRSVGKFAWIPTKVVPYVGAGGGMMWYRLRQTGEFIDVATTDVFPDTFESSGWTPTAHGLAGVDYSLTPRFALNGEARYTWAKAKLGPDFEGFDKIDLSDIGITFGLNVRF